MIWIIMCVCLCGMMSMICTSLSLHSIRSNWCKLDSSHVYDMEEKKQRFESYSDWIKHISVIIYLILCAVLCSEWTKNWSNQHVFRIIFKKKKNVCLSVLCLYSVFLFSTCCIQCVTKMMFEWWNSFLIID